MGTQKIIKEDEDRNLIEVTVSKDDIIAMKTIVDNLQGKFDTNYDSPDNVIKFTPHIENKDDNFNSEEMKKILDNMRELEKIAEPVYGEHLETVITNMRQIAFKDMIWFASKLLNELQKINLDEIESDKLALVLIKTCDGLDDEIREIKRRKKC